VTMAPSYGCSCDHLGDLIAAGIDGRLHARGASGNSAVWQSGTTPRQVGRSSGANIDALGRRTFPLTAPSDQE
jgi:hypothetical protein